MVKDYEAKRTGIGGLCEVIAARKESSRKGVLHQRRRWITRELAELTSAGWRRQRRVQVPKGDVLHRFREDVRGDAARGQLAGSSGKAFGSSRIRVVWGLVYIRGNSHLNRESRGLEKTVFILTYDENDGYFDHVPPFVGRGSAPAGNGIHVQGAADASLEYVHLEQDEKVEPRSPRQSPIGLGYRVPMVIASPWSRGGCVCSQVFDNTSVLMFLEKFLSEKTGGPIKETNISSWQQAICGDLASAFQPSPDGKEANPQIPVTRPFCAADL